MPAFCRAGNSYLGERGYHPTSCLLRLPSITVISVEILIHNFEAVLMIRIFSIWPFYGNRNCRHYLALINPGKQQVVAYRWPRYKFDYLAGIIRKHDNTLL
jgi:hypothetical protein